LLAACAAIALLAPAAAPFAASTPEAAEWLDKMAASAGGAFRTKYRGTMEQSAMGLAMRIEGDLVQIDPTHVRSELTMHMGGGESSPALQVSVLTVADGKHAWTETELLGGKQVVKASLDDLADLAKEDARLRHVQSSDPLGQIRQMAETFDFVVRGRDEGKVTLSAKLTAEGLAELGQELPEETAQALSEVTLVVHEKTGFPASIAVGGETPFLTMHFDEFEVVDPAKVPPETFAYTPPEGAPVMDIGATLGAAPEKTD
jgi:hypothetical protein